MKKQISQCRSVDDFDALSRQPEFKLAFNGLPAGLQAEILRHGKDTRAKLNTPALMAG